jgi:hypothetical protein
MAIKGSCHRGNTQFEVGEAPLSATRCDRRQESMVTPAAAAAVRWLTGSHHKAENARNVAA